MTEPTPTPEKQNLSATPDSEAARQDENSSSSTPERDGFFRRVRRGLHEPTEPIHPSEAKEIVVDDADLS